MERYSENTATPAELQELSDFIASSPDDEAFTDIMVEHLERNPLINKNLPAFERLADKVLENHRPGRSAKWVWAAACTVLVALSGIYYARQHREEGVTTAKKEEKVVPRVAVPGKNGAILTLADGSTIALDSAGNGKIAS